MIPGFVTIYRDADNYINLYFYPGIDDANNNLYKPLELLDYENDYNKIVNIDDSIIFKFRNKNIKSIFCKLVSNDDVKNIKLKI